MTACGAVETSACGCGRRAYNDACGEMCSVGREQSTEIERNWLMTEMGQETSAGSMGERVQGVIDRIRPLLQADGGDIELVGIDEDTGVVSVRLQGACKGCPGAAMTLKMGVERHLREKVPEVNEVVAVE